MAWHLPVAPRPYKEELLSSWLARVACRYGLTHQALAGWLADGGKTFSPFQPVDDRCPADEFVQQWGRGCGIDPDQLRRLSLRQRHPRRPDYWYVARGPDWASAATIATPPVCLACLASDHVDGRDAWIRADWSLAEHCICSVHGQLLHDRCTTCCHHLSIGFRLREGRACAVCSRCEAVLVDRGGEGIVRQDADLMKSALSVQRQVAISIDGESRGREWLEHALETLWAPLDRPGAARPALALWLNGAGWRCPFEVRQAVGIKAPLGHLPVRWRFITLLALSDVFGAEPTGTRPTSEISSRLTCRAILRREQSPPPPPRVASSSLRSPAEYEHLANQILSDPVWIAAQQLPRHKRDRARGRLIDAALSKD